MGFWANLFRPPEPFQALTADARIISGPTPDQSQTVIGGRQIQKYRTPDEWQRELWNFHDELGELRQGLNWKANMLSRVRLIAARMVPGQDEPQRVKEGPAADIVAKLAGGIGGQAKLMSSFAVYLDLPGECYLIGETLPNGRDKWYTLSIEEVQPALSYETGRFRVSEGHGQWRVLPADSLVCRVWRAHKRWHNVADSPARACRSLLRELELINRHIAAQYMSRLASAGVIIFPEEVTFPVREEFADAADPFVAEWIEIAAEALRTPGTAAAVVPIPIKMPGEYVNQVRHIDFTLKLDDKIIEKRDSALARLAIELDMPPEAMLGTRDVNHWNAWLIDEQGVKIHVAPDAEIVCDALTDGYLRPMLTAIGENPDDYLVWFDASELILRPDRSKSASDVYDRGELSGATLRSQHGFSETDKPSDDERKQILLTQSALTQPVNFPAVMKELYPDVELVTQPVDAPRPDPVAPAAPGEQPNPDNSRGTPAKKKPADRASAPDRSAAEAEYKVLMIKLSKLMHAVKIHFDGQWSVLHPPECREHLFGCPITHATWTAVDVARPGTSGIYKCWLNASGDPVLGDRMTDLDATIMTPSTVVNGITKVKTLLIDPPTDAEIRDLLGVE
jgi:hypothetical protein